MPYNGTTRPQNAAHLVVHFGGLTEFGSIRKIM